MPELIPVRVVAELASGVGATSGWGPSLDGIVASQMWAERKEELLAAGEEPAGLDPERDPEDLDLPFARVEYAEGWYWASTCGYPDELDPRPEVRYWTGRADQAALAVLADSPPAAIPDRQGRLRSRVMPLAVLMCRRMVWHAVADPVRLQQVLGPVRAIGKKRGCGEGEVRSWIVEPVDICPFAAAHLHPDGTLGRPTPIAVLGEQPTIKTGARAVLGVRPPVMHPSRRAAVWLPPA